MIFERMIDSLPKYERKSKLIQEIFSVVARYLEISQSEIDNNYKELFIDTADKALSIHARDLGVSLNSNLNLTQKRELITAYYRAAFEQTNEETIKNIASSFSGGTVEISSTEKDGVFSIKFIDIYGVPTNIEGLQEAIKTILPAHLEVVYEYSYLLVKDVNSLKISELQQMPLSKFAGGKK